jgi:uncharacterized protein YjiS (DUF1127 family)
MLEASPAFRRRARLADMFRRLLAWPAHVAEARRTLARLGQMSDRELGDIGLLRSDLADASALPRDEDPGRRLAQTRAARARFAPRNRHRAPSAGLGAPRHESDCLFRREIDEGGQGTELAGA